MDNFWLLLRKQSHSPDVNLCNWAIKFWSKGDLEGVGSLLLIECPVGFDHNDLTHLPTHPKLQKILSPDLHRLVKRLEFKTLAFADQSSQ